MSQKITERLIVAGDYYSFPSQQGAMLSGRKAAELIISDQ
jgi:predicted NAD/FAD-dependent oxidoreductase